MTSNRGPVHKLHVPKSKQNTGHPGTEKKRGKKTFSLHTGKYY